MYKSKSIYKNGCTKNKLKKHLLGFLKFDSKQIKFSFLSSKLINKLNIEYLI